MKKVLLLALFLAACLVQAKDLKPYDGAPLPDFTLSDMQSKSHTLSNYKGKVVMLNFWATYCGPCIKEMPSMQRLKDKMAGKPFVILAVVFVNGSRSYTIVNAHNRGKVCRHIHMSHKPVENRISTHYL